MCNKSLCMAFEREWARELTPLRNVDAFYYKRAIPSYHHQWCANANAHSHKRAHTPTTFIATNTRIHILHALMHRLKRISTVVNMNFTTVITVMKPRTRKPFQAIAAVYWCTLSLSPPLDLNIASPIQKLRCFLSLSPTSLRVNEHILMRRNLFQFFNVIVFNQEMIVIHCDKSAKKHVLGHKENRMKWWAVCSLYRHQKLALWKSSIFEIK